MSLGRIILTTHNLLTETISSDENFEILQQTPTFYPALEPITTLRTQAPSYNPQPSPIASAESFQIFFHSTLLNRQDEAHYFNDSKHVRRSHSNRPILSILKIWRTSDSQQHDCNIS